MPASPSSCSTVVSPSGSRWRPAGGRKPFLPFLDFLPSLAARVGIRLLAAVASGAYPSVTGPAPASPVPWSEAAVPHWEQNRSSSSMSLPQLPHMHLTRTPFMEVPPSPRSASEPSPSMNSALLALSMHLQSAAQVQGFWPQHSQASPSSPLWWIGISAERPWPRSAPMTNAGFFALSFFLPLVASFARQESGSSATNEGPFRFAMRMMMALIWSEL